MKKLNRLARFEYFKNNKGKAPIKRQTILFSEYYDFDEETFRNLMVHEMIHYWILSNQMQDTGPHGKIFLEKMKEINMKFNRNLSVAHKMTKEEADQDKEVRQHIICVSRLRNGKRGVTVVTKSRLFQLWEEMPNFPNMAELRWVVSLDPYFNRFPRATVAKVYPVPSEELEEHLKDAQELVRSGNSIRIKK